MQAFFARYRSVLRAKASAAGTHLPPGVSVFKVWHIVGIELLKAEVVLHDEGSCLHAHMTVYAFTSDGTVRDFEGRLPTVSSCFWPCRVFIAV